MGYTLTLEDQNGNTYTFDGSFKIDNESFNLNNVMQKIAYFPGSNNTGDKFLTDRVMTISGSIQEDTVAAGEAAYSAFKIALLKGGKLRKSGDIVSRYCNVVCADVNPGFEMTMTGGGYFREGISANLLLEFPFWEDESETTDATTVTGNDELSVDTTGTEEILYPIIEIEADQSVDLPGIMLYNKSDGGMQLIYNNPGFVQGDILIIDCKEGTVKLNSNLSFEYFTGAFLRLQRGINLIDYEGSAATIRVKYRKVYL
jgi:hypothetical protein